MLWVFRFFCPNPVIKIGKSDDELNDIQCAGSGETTKNLNIAKLWITLSCNRTSTILLNLFIFLL